MPLLRSSPQNVASSNTAAIPPSRKGFAQLTKGVVRREHWANEILALVLSLVIIIAMVAILRQYQNQPLESWNPPFTLNPFLSIMVTILDLLLTGVISSCVHQLKWLHFDKFRSLVAFEDYSKIARGGFSILTTVSRSLKRARIWFIVLLVIAVNTVGPFTQQILSVDLAAFPQANGAYLPVAYDISNASLWQEDFDAAGLAVYNSRGLAFSHVVNQAMSTGLLFTGTDRLNLNVTSTCESGNCTWDEYSTLAVRSRVSDVTDQLIWAPARRISQYSNETDSYDSGNAILDWTDGPVTLPQTVVSLPDSNILAPGIPLGYVMDGIAENIDSSRAEDGSSVPKSTPEGLRVAAEMKIVYIQPFANVTDDSGPYPANETVWTDPVFLELHIYAQNLKIEGTYTNGSWTNISIATDNLSYAWRCTFDFVMQIMQADEQDGRFTEVELDLVPYSGLPGYVDPKRPDLPALMNFMHGGTQLSVDIWTMYAIYIQAYNLLLSSTYELPELNVTDSTGKLYQSNWTTGGQSKEFTQAILDVIADETRSRSADTDQSGIFLPNSTIAGSMDELARSFTHSFRENTQDVVGGTMTFMHVIYQIRWPWITVPVVITVLTAMLVILTVYETRKQGLPTWTDSELAVMVHGLDEHTRKDLAKFRRLEDLEEACKNTTVMLRKDKLVLEAGVELPPKDESAGGTLP